MFGTEFFDPQYMWLNLTNLGLGIVTLLSVVAVAWGVASELFERAHAKVAIPRESDDHAFMVPGLGMTMADGGKKLDDEAKKPKE